MSNTMPASNDATRPQAPAFLMAKVKVAKERARSQRPAAPTSSHQDAAQGSPQPPIAAGKEPHPKRTASTRGNVAAAILAPDVLPREIDGTFDAQAALALFETHAKDTAALDLLRPVLPAVLDTIVAGALVRGTSGFQDRMTLFRMLGVPWTQTSSSKQDRAQGDDGFANRMVRAISRVEGRVRHARVTVDVAYDDDGGQPPTIEGEVSRPGDGGL
jgi:hypothetical protein